MDRSRTATIARAGGRLAAALLPLAAFAVIRAISSAQSTPVSWLAPGIAATAAAMAGLALLVAGAATLDAGRVRDLGDMAGLGMLTVAFAVAALDGTAPLGLGVGVAAAAVAFAAGSSAGGRTVPSRRSRALGVAIAFLLVEACLAAVLYAGAAVSDGRMAPILLGGAAVLLAVAALAGLDEAARAAALGLAASATLAMALADPAGSERLVGPAGIAVASVVVGWSLLVHRFRRVPATQLAPRTALRHEPDYDEGSRLTRELRATLDDLASARRTVELQRAEIERATTIDPLTGLAGRGPTLERLRIEAAEARRYAHPVSVVLLDVDHFAQLNHDHGLKVGDAILREVALRLRVRVREADALGRIGSDAFLAVLPHTDEGGAATFAQAILDRLIERRFATDRGEMTVSVSIGIALMRAGMTLSEEELLAAAEEALASAKAAGGNRIAFDRLHGLARLDERRTPSNEPAERPAADEADATR